MAYNLNHMAKRFLLLMLAFALVISVSYHPSNSQTVHAAGLPVVDIPAKVERIIDVIGMAIAQRMVDSMVQSTVKWAQSGFDGNPAYATNPKQYFADIADGVAGEFIRGSDLGFLCSPFQAQIRLSLVQQYTEDPRPFQCTLTGINGNIEDFYKDFSSGGWGSWFSMTQNSNNNPYGAFLKARIELDSRIAENIGIEKTQLDWNQGFLSWKGECPADKTVTAEQAAEWADSEIYDREGLPYEAGDCLDNSLKPIATPGSTIKSQLDRVLPSGMERLINAQHIDQLVSGFASGLLNRYVFGSKGLFASGSSSSSSGGASGGNVLDSRIGKIDTDGDNIPEGEDMDKDGALVSSVDICYHGGSAPNCITSRNATQSPYLEPLCNSVERATNTLTEFTRFMDANADQMQGGASLKGRIITGILTGPVGAIFGGFFGGGSIDNFVDEADSTIWHNKAAAVDGSITSVIRNIQEINIPYFDSTEVVVNRYSFYIDKVSESLIQNRDLDLAKIGNGGGGLENLMKKTAYNLRYLQEVKSRLGQCSLPNMTDLNSIATPPEDSSGGGEQCLATGQRYEEVLDTAMDTVLAERPDIANLPNIEDGGRQNARTFLALVEAELISMGYLATDTVLNGNNNPNTGDLIAVWRSGDATMERYDAIIGSAATIRDAAQSSFTGFVPLGCTPSGGSRDCACDNGGGGTTPAPGTEPASLINDVRAERDKYASSFNSLCTNPSGLEPDSCPLGKILNDVAWKNKDSGWVLLGKDGGHRCKTPSGKTVSCDYLVHQPTMYGYDVLRDAEGDAEAIWDGPDTSIGSQVNSGSRTLVTPTAP